MGRRPWQCYAYWGGAAYQRKRSHKKDLVRGGADVRIRLYDVGAKEIPKENWDCAIGLICNRQRQISDFALEAIRTSVNRTLQRDLGKDRFHMIIRIHPWNVYRENKMMAFAGADRLQTGMRHSFGKCVGHAARVKAGQLIMELRVNLKDLEKAKEAMHVASYKITSGSRLIQLWAKSPEIAKKIGLQTD
ncbi:MAG: 50S ribosomal protein L10e [Promethearchaeota archaeon CR_4]|nr:MAG: 50S ribosomal protein L10e [Candidatus Lokiarchaeota archaeon CR_4]